MTPEEAHCRCQHALDNDDVAAAEFWLLVLQTLNAEAEDRQIARAVRDCELYAQVHAGRWWWVE